MPFLDNVLRLISNLVFVLSLFRLTFGETYADFWNDPDVQSCFAKIRTVASVNSDVRKPIDRVAITARLDLLYETFTELITGICSSNETKVCEDFLDMYMPAIEIANDTTNNMTENQTKQLDKWIADGNYQAERQFFLGLYNNLTVEDQQTLRQAFTEIMNMFAGSSLKNYMNNFLRGLNYDDQQKLKEYGQEDNSCGINNMVKDKLNNNGASSNEIKDLEKFLTWAFMQGKTK